MRIKENKNPEPGKKRKFDIDWPTINSLSISEVCDWLDIDIVKNKMQCPSGTHTDRNPSCSVKDDRYCRCFACGYHAKPFQLIMDVKKLDRINAAKFVNQYVKVITPIKADTPTAEITPLTSWELACLHLDKNPFYAFSEDDSVLLQNDPVYADPKLWPKYPNNPEKDDSKLVKNKEGEYYFPKKSQLKYSVEFARELVFNNYIQYCPSEEKFIQEYKNYVYSLLAKAMTNSLIEHCPSSELWLQDANEYKQKMHSYERKVASCFLNNTGLKFQVLFDWYMNDKNKLINKAIEVRAKEYYQIFSEKMDQLSEILAEEEEQEEVEYGRASDTTMAR